MDVEALHAAPVAASAHPGKHPHFTVAFTSSCVSMVDHRFDHSIPISPARGCRVATVCRGVDLVDRVLDPQQASATQLAARTRLFGVALPRYDCSIYKAVAAI